MTAEAKTKTTSILSRIIRVVTVAPLVSLVLFTVLLLRGGVFENIWEYLSSLLLLTILPLLAYPLQKVLPPFRERGRDGQRTLAMIMANVGYLISIVYALALRVSDSLLTVFLTYLISGALLLVINKVFGIKASGHACGLAGPVAVLVYYTGWLSLIIGATLLILTLWGSLKMKRHTVPQFIIGGTVSVLTFSLLTIVML